MSLQGSGYSGQSYGADHRHQTTSGVTTRLTHRDYPTSSTTATPVIISSSYSRAVSGIYDTVHQSPLTGAPASSALLDMAFHHPQTAWTPPPYRSSPSRSSQSPPEDVAPHYDYISTGGPDYVALSAMLSTASGTETVQIIPGRGRVVKRRFSANRKERRRTHSINSAFSALRGCIPNVPSDTKLSKIKTLRLATSYIAYLMDILSKDDPIAQRQLHEAGFKADISRKIESREERRRRETEVNVF